MPARDWLLRAVTAGFVATIMMTLAFFAGYGSAVVLASMDLGGRLVGWLDALADNPVLDFAGRVLSVSLALHLATGLLWALVYAAFAEPRLPGLRWQRGVIFSVVPWALSLLVFFPLLGGGFLGLGMGAGPLPAIASLILHFIYGATLGVAYGPPAREPLAAPITQRESSRLEGAMTGGLLAGGILGLVVSVVLVSSPLQIEEGLNIPGALLVLGATLIGGAWGAFVGSLFGLPNSPVRR